MPHSHSISDQEHNPKCVTSNHTSCRELCNHMTCSFTIQAVHENHGEKMDSPSNGVSIVGYLRPAFIEEESYLRTLFHGGRKSDGYSSDWKGNYKKIQMRGVFFSFLDVILQSNANSDAVNETDEYNRETQSISETDRLVGNLIGSYLAP